MDSLRVKVATSIILARRTSLAKLLEKHRYLPLAEVCTRFSISAATARRDLSALARDRRLTRTYGGALSASDVNPVSFVDRRSLGRLAKLEIARRAVSYIVPQTTCFFDSGTTIFAVAEALYREPVDGLRAVTNSLPVAEVLGRCAEIEVHLLGGRFMQRQSTLLGKEACESARRWKFDLVFLGAEAISAKGVWASEPRVAAFQKTLIARTRQAIVCAHSLKADRETGTFLCPWSSKMKLISEVKLKFPKDLKR